MAARADYRAVPEMGLLARAGRAFAYVLVVVTFTVVAGLGGYQVGVRSRPSDALTGSQREQAQRAAIREAVVAQTATDRRLRRSALASAMSWQRARFEEELSAKVSEVRLSEAANAARAYRRGREAGRDALITEVQQHKSAEAGKPAGDATPAAQR
jgi:hypothetical protein